MPRVAFCTKQRKRNKIKALIEWIDGRMHSKELKQEYVAKQLNISQPAFSIRMNPKTYEKNKDADPFSFGDLLILFDILEATPEEKTRLMTLL